MTVNNPVNTGTYPRINGRAYGAGFTHKRSRHSRINGRAYLLPVTSLYEKALYGLAPSVDGLRPPHSGARPVSQCDLETETP